MNAVRPSPQERLIALRKLHLAQRKRGQRIERALLIATIIVGIPLAVCLWIIALS